MISDLVIKIIDNDLNKKENIKKYQIPKYFEYFNEYKKTRHLKKTLHKELIETFKVKEKEKQFNTILENSLNGICTICYERINFIEKRKFVFRSILSCLVKPNKQFYNITPTILNCGHVYHEKCIEKWFTYSHNQMCPNCGI